MNWKLCHGASMAGLATRQMVYGFGFVAPGRNTCRSTLPAMGSPLFQWNAVRHGHAEAGLPGRFGGHGLEVSGGPIERPVSIRDSQFVADVSAEGQEEAAESE